MKALMSALVAAAVLAGIATPAGAVDLDRNCFPGYAQAHDSCVLSGGGG